MFFDFRVYAFSTHALGFSQPKTPTQPNTFKRPISHRNTQSSIKRLANQSLNAAHSPPLSHETEIEKRGEERALGEENRKRNNKRKDRLRRNFLDHKPLRGNPTRK